MFFCHNFTGEEINSPQLIFDLADRDTDAPIFGKLGFTYGKASRFKQEFETKKASHHGRGRLRPLICSPAPSKPTMVEIANFTPEMKQLYLSKYVIGLINYLFMFCIFISCELIKHGRRKIS